jgi:hypothetical protein
VRGLTPEQLEAALAPIDRANAVDPNRVAWRGGSEPLAQLQGVLATDWVHRLRTDADPALLLAARAHHLRRWTVPRATYPAGRAGYLRWRKDLKQRHADELAEVLAPLALDPALVARAGRLITRVDLQTDPDARTVEDAACLVFLQLQLDGVAEALADEDHVVEILRKTARKMSADGLAAAATIELSPTGAALLARALTA